LEAPPDLFALTAAQPAVPSTDEVAPVARLVHDAFFSGRGGIHHMWWETSNQSGDAFAPIAPRGGDWSRSSRCCLSSSSARSAAFTLVSIDVGVMAIAVSVDGVRLLGAVGRRSRLVAGAAAAEAGAIAVAVVFDALGSLSAA
jgi:hypothetical protein